VIATFAKINVMVTGASIYFILITFTAIPPSPFRRGAGGEVEILIYNFKFIYVNINYIELLFIIIFSKNSLI